MMCEANTALRNSGDVNCRPWRSRCGRSGSTIGPGACPAAYLRTGVPRRRGLRSLCVRRGRGRAAVETAMGKAASRDHVDEPEPGQSPNPDPILPHQARLAQDVEFLRNARLVGDRVEAQQGPYSGEAPRTPTTQRPQEGPLQIGQKRSGSEGMPHRARLVRCRTVDQLSSHRARRRRPESPRHCGDCHQGSAGPSVAEIPPCLP